jgi:hypothetical protein
MNNVKPKCLFQALACFKFASSGSEAGYAENRIKE